MATTIGFIGLGNIGAPMCRRLIEAGYEVHAFDLDEAKLGEAVDHGAAAAQSAAVCAGKVDVLLTSLPRPDHVEAVMRGAGALKSMRPGSIWVDLTTNRKELVAELAAEAPEGVGVVDSPVTGAVDGARNGRLTLFAGGKAEHLKQVTPILENLGTVITCGGLGTGNVVKLVPTSCGSSPPRSVKASPLACATASNWTCCGQRSSSRSVTPSSRATTRRQSSPDTTTPHSAWVCASRTFA